jgi:hypothetical protein
VWPLALLTGTADVTVFGVLGFTDPLTGGGEVVPAARRGAGQRGAGDPVLADALELGREAGVARISSLLPASWTAAHLPALNPAQLAGVKSAVSVGAAPVTSSTPPQVAREIIDISHATFASGMHTAFLVAAAVALAGALIGLLTRPAPAAPKPPTPGSDARIIV